LPYTSVAVSVKLCNREGAAGDGYPVNTNVAVAEGFTLMLDCLPVTEGMLTSVAVKDCTPAVSRVAVKVCTPASVVVNV
jgi:hypothetical protein